MGNAEYMGDFCLLELLHLENTPYQNKQKLEKVYNTEKIYGKLGINFTCFIRWLFWEFLSFEILFATLLVHYLHLGSQVFRGVCTQKLTMVMQSFRQQSHKLEAVCWVWDGCFFSFLVYNFNK